MRSAFNDSVSPWQQAAKTISESSPLQAKTEGKALPASLVIAGPGSVSWLQPPAAAQINANARRVARAGFSHRHAVTPIGQGYSAATRMVRVSGATAAFRHSRHLAVGK